MQPKQVIRGILTPILEPAVLAVVVLFAVLLTLGIKGGPLGILVILLSLPPIFRYHMLIVEDCARGAQPGALDAEYFNWIGGAYSFFPLPVAFAYAFAGIYVNENFAIPGLVVLALFACLQYPAMLALLAITHSPLQSINPVAIYHLYRKSGGVLWIASVYLVVINFAYVKIETASIPLIVANALQLFFMFSFSALIGTLIAPEKLVDDIYIPEPTEPIRDKATADIEQARVSAMAHAYAFISRNNREGGFKHIMEEIERDPLPTEAWKWYFDGMLKWEERHHALFFAQHYIRDLLRHGEPIPAQKLTMRCLMLNEQFRPFSEDVPALIKVAEDSGNDELATVLKGM